MIAPVHPLPPPASEAAPLAVRITDAAVSPARAVLLPGTRVTWRNTGRNRHTVTADDGSFESGSLAPGNGFTITAPAAAGEYGYFCRFHAFIRGTLVVSLVSLETPRPVLAGQRAALTGAAPGAPGTPVTIQRRVPGAWEPIAAATTGADGAFAAATPPLRGRAALRAVVGDAVSPSVRAEVRPHLRVARSGGAVRVAAMPAPVGARARLDRLNLDTYRWGTVRRAVVGAAGTVRFTLGAAGVYRVRIGPGSGLSAATTAPVLHRPSRFRR